MTDVFLMFCLTAFGIGVGYMWASLESTDKKVQKNKQ